MILMTLTFLDLASRSSNISQIMLIFCWKSYRSPYWPRGRARVLISAFTAKQSSLWPRLLLHSSSLTLHQSFCHLCCSLNLAVVFFLRLFTLNAPFCRKHVLRQLHGSVSKVRHRITFSHLPWPSPTACIFLACFVFLYIPFHLLTWSLLPLILFAPLELKFHKGRDFCLFVYCCIPKTRTGPDMY